MADAIHPIQPPPSKGSSRLLRRFDELSPWRSAALVGLFCWGISFFFYSPPFWMPLSGGDATPARIDDFNALCANPLERNLNEPILAYRIITPMLAWMLGLRGFSGVILQYAAIPAFLSVVYYAMTERTIRRIAFLATLGVACTYTIIWTNTKPGYPDSITHLAGAILLLTQNRYAQVVLTAIGTLNDERFILVIPFIILWHANTHTLTDFVMTSWKSCLSILGGLAIVIVLRQALTHGIIGPGIQAPEVYREIADVASNGFGSPHDGWKAYSVNVFMAYRALWIAFLIAITVPATWINRGIFIGSMMLVVAFSATVADTGRSIGFAYPAFLLATAAISNVGPSAQKLLSALVILTLLTPCLYASSGGNHLLGLEFQLERPLPLSLLRAWTGWDVVDLLRK